MLILKGMFALLSYQTKFQISKNSKSTNPMIFEYMLSCLNKGV